MKTQAFAFSALLVGALVACGSSSDSSNEGNHPNGGTTTDKSGTDPTTGGSSGKSPTPSGTMELSLAEANCDHGFACDPAFYGTYWDSVDTCASFFESTYYKLERAAPGTGLTPAAEAACATAVVNADCATDVDQLPACNIKGTLANGASCYEDRSCASGNCMGLAQTGCGTCGDKAALGAACDSNECADGLGCDYSQTSPVCATVPDTGGTGCQYLGCVKYGDTCNNNVCTTTLAKGAACTAPTQQGEADLCPRNQACTNGVCTDLVLANPGADCSAANVACADGMCTNNVCVANGQSGAACDPQTNNCANGMVCDQTKKVCFLGDTTAPTCP